VEPLRVTAGDTWTWVRALADYPASAGWVLTYYLSLAAAAPKVITCTAQGDDHLAAVDATSSAAWAAGDYHWIARAVKGAEAHSVATGTLRVLPDPTATVDRRSWEEKILAVLEPAILASAGSLMVEYELDGVKAKISRTEALALLDRCRTAVRVQRGGPVARQILVRFGRV
jgi:hypothetical protein